MKRILFITILSFLPLIVFGQYIGVGYQYADFKSHQFVATAALPWITPSRSGNLYFASGLEYSTKAAPISGINLRPICVSVPFFTRKAKWTIEPGVDGGYLWGLGHARDGLVMSPNVNFEYSMVFRVRIGYDYNIRANNGQFYVRLAMGIGSGGFSFIKTMNSLNRRVSRGIFH